MKVVEVPPGPPVIATLLAEIYGPDAATRRAVAEETKQLFKSVPFIVDVDDSYGVPRPRLRLNVKRDALEFFSLERTRRVGLGGGAADGHRRRLFASRRGAQSARRSPCACPEQILSWNARLTATPVGVTQTAAGAKTIELGEVMEAAREPGSLPFFRRDGHFAEMVTAELAGAYEAPIYGMLDVGAAVDAHDWGKLPKPVIRLYGQPEDETKPSLLWDGEWEITYVTFRDMGAAFMVALLGIYVLVVAQFRASSCRS